jgi:hypothetical protein
MGVRNSVPDFEDSQAVPACPSGIGRAYNRIFYILYCHMLEWVHYSKIFANVGRATLGRNFDVTNGRAACEACSAT